MPTVKLAEDFPNVGGNQKCADTQQGRRHNPVRPREVAEKCQCMNTGDKRSLQDQNQHAGREPRSNGKVNERKTKKNRQYIDHDPREKAEITMIRMPITLPKSRKSATRSNPDRPLRDSLAAHSPAILR